MTAQVGEVLILNGEETSMTFCPPLPEGHRRLRAVDEREAREQSDGIIFSTACWRGYQGTWEIQDGQLYLNEVVGRFRLEGDAPLFADWVSAVIRVPRGEMLEYVHMGFESTYERELLIEVRRGAVVSTREVNNRGEPRGRDDAR